MLTAVSSHSPKPYIHEAPNHGRAASLHAEYQTPPFVLPQITHPSSSTNVHPENRRRSTLSTTAAQRNYRDVGTQYSPPHRDRAVDTVPVALLQVEGIPQARDEVVGLVDPEQISSNAGLVTNPERPPTNHRGHQLDPTYASGALQTPIIKRRKSREVHESPTKIITARSKRAKPTKTAAKLLPAQYELCSVDDIVILIADMISQLISTNDNLPLQDGVLTRFHSRTAPGISVLHYLQRLAKHATLTPPLLLAMVYYIDRLCSLYPAFTITTLTVHRFLITAATVAAKGLSDSFWNNSLYARVGGIKLAELGMLELEFLYRVDWRIVPDPETLVDYYKGLVARTDEYVLDEDGLTQEVVMEMEDGQDPREVEVL